MAEQRENGVVSAGPVVRSDDERTVTESDSGADGEFEVPLDAPFEAAIEDVLEQRHIEPLDDEYEDR